MLPYLKLFILHMRKKLLDEQDYEEGEPMKKITVYFTVMALMCLCSSPLLAVTGDISGTWVGETEVPDSLDADVLTLIISKKDGKYMGIVSDTLGFASETECDNFVVQENDLSFTFEISDGYEVQTIYIKLKVAGDSMTGFWENEGGDGAEVTLVKKK